MHGSGWGGYVVGGADDGSVPSATAVANPTTSMAHTIPLTSNFRIPFLPRYGRRTLAQESRRRE